MPIRTVYVYVYLPGETAPTPAGILEHNEDRQNSFSTFHYGAKYLSHPKRIAVDPTALPLALSAETEYRTEEGFSLFNGIRDASPDGWGRHVLDREFRRELSEVDYLLLAGEQRAGALAFGENLSGPLRRGKETEGEIVSLEELMEEAEKVDDEEELSPKHRRFFVRGSSLGGARPKAVTQRNDEWWLAKFSRKDDRFNVVRAEYAAMSLAKKAGLTVPDIDIVTVLDKQIFLIKRFDRHGKAEPNQYSRQHFQSALSMLGAHESEGHKRSYESIAEVIRRWSPTPESDALELYRRMIFNILINNTDDHLRNHGFLFENNRWKLSPLYDVLPTRQVGTERDLALGVGREGRRATLKNALTKCRAFYLTHERAKQEIEFLKNHVKNWREHFKACGFSKSELTQVETCFLALEESVDQ